MWGACDRMVCISAEEGLCTTLYYLKVKQKWYKDPSSASSNYHQIEKPPTSVKTTTFLSELVQIVQTCTSQKSWASAKLNQLVKFDKFMLRTSSTVPIQYKYLYHSDTSIYLVSMPESLRTPFVYFCLPSLPMTMANENSTFVILYHYIIFPEVTNLLQHVYDYIEWCVRSRLSNPPSTVSQDSEILGLVGLRGNRKVHSSPKRHKKIVVLLMQVDIASDPPEVACGRMWRYDLPFCRRKDLFSNQQNDTKTLHSQSWTIIWELLTGLHCTAPYPNGISDSKKNNWAHIFLASSNVSASVFKTNISNYPRHFDYSVWLGTLAAPLPRVGQLRSMHEIAFWWGMMDVSADIQKTWKREPNWVKHRLRWILGEPWPRCSDAELNQPTECSSRGFYWSSLAHSSGFLEL